MLGINARVEDLRDQIIKDINQAKMPACILDYMLTEILNDVRSQRISEVQKERRMYKEEMTPAPGEVPVPKKDTGHIEKGTGQPEQAQAEQAVKGGTEDGSDDHAGS